MKCLISILVLLLSPSFAFANQDSTILTCKSIEKMGRTEYTSENKELFKDEKNLGKFHLMNDYLRDFVVTDLNSEAPVLKTIFYNEGNKKPLLSEEPVNVVKRTEDEIVLSYARGVETGMITLWIKENKAVFFYSQISTDLSAYIIAYECK